jgi:acyl-CoA hydrolase
VSQVTNPVSPGDAVSVATYTGSAGTTSNQFWVTVYLERFPGDPSYAGAVSDTVVASCD